MTQSPSVAIIDYGMGNLDSVRRAVEECGGNAFIAHDPADVKGASHLILPGVGAFAAGMHNLRSGGWEAPLRELVLEQKVPCLGICLGMQLLATNGTEGGTNVGLGWIEGEVRLFEPSDPTERVPHVGWNQVEHNGAEPLLAHIPSGTDFYFVHSYYFQCHRPEESVATTPYAGGFTSVVHRDNLWGV